MIAAATEEQLRNLQRDGFVIVPGVLSVSELVGLREAAAIVFAQERRPRAGVRGLTGRHPAFAALPSSPEVRALLEPVLGAGAFLVRSILFDKTPEANWDVVWHQDTTIPVTGRRDAAGFGPWSVKHGIPHVQPPGAVLERMLTVRLHLDDCTASNGALQVVPGSHRRGIIPERRIDAAACEAQACTCEVPAGGALLMRPLILHASKKAAAATHRRIVHLEFAAEPLPTCLEWAPC